MANAGSDLWFESIWWLEEGEYGCMLSCKDRRAAIEAARADATRGFGKPGRDEIHIIHEVTTVEVFEPEEAKHSDPV